MPVGIRKLFSVGVVTVCVLIGGRTGEQPGPRRPGSPHDRPGKRVGH